MLVLTRKLGEGIKIGEEIRIIVLEIKGGQVKLGIEAPSHTAIHREEVFLKIQNENKKAAATQPNHLQRILKKAEGTSLNVKRRNPLSHKD
jgi:carbon storage regulator